MRIHHYLLGYEEIAVSQRHRACFLNVCRSTGWAYQPIGSEGEGEMLVRCRADVAARLRAACASRGIDIRTVRRGGLPLLLWRYRSRVGLLVGVLLAVLLVRVGCGVLWDVRVSGNVTLSDEAIVEQLQQCGLGVGSVLEKAPDSREIENRMLRASPDIAWISVNIRGTVADVQIRELQKRQSAVDEEIVNLVASCDGTVESVRLLSGEVVVGVGQQVRAGELLISGVRDSGTHGFDVVGARGEVMARTEHTEIVQIPLQIEQKVYAEEQKSEKSLFFFGKSIKFSKNTGIIGGSCDTIYIMEKWTLPTGLTLPLGWETIRYQPYELRTVTRTRSEAYELACASLDARLKASAADALLLSKSVRVSYSETHCTLVCDYACLRNIAVPAPLLYSPQ